MKPLCGGLGAALCLAATLLCSAAFTIDCDRDYTDCDKELSKLSDETDPISSIATNASNKLSELVKELQIKDTETKEPVIKETNQKGDIKESETTEVVKEILSTSESPKITNAKGRYLNISINDLQEFANSLHNETQTEKVAKKSVDLSDVTLDDDDFEYSPHKFATAESRVVNKTPPTFTIPILESREDTKTSKEEPKGSKEEIKSSEEAADGCIEIGISYKVGEKVDHSCDETCECGRNGKWNCHQRCENPYIRRGRSFPDPLCYETPVDDCCAIVACSTHTESDNKSQRSPMDFKKMCRYGNKSYAFEEQWEVGCELKCSCGPDSVVTCKPRCESLVASDQCINVQDPHDSCCQVQICDVTHDGHEHEESPSVTTMQDRMDSSDDETIFTTELNLPPRSTSVSRSPTEPVTGVTVLNNNTVSVSISRSNTTNNMFHLQISADGEPNEKDIELGSGNIIENLESNKNYTLKVKETGTSFKFATTQKGIDTTTTEFVKNEPIHVLNEINTESNASVGCFAEGLFYRVGEEFRIGCSELCECVGPNESECAALDCPSHVGLELVSPTCVRWAPDPPDWVPNPPACCPTKMRCLSDGSCDYQGHKIPNWSEVPESLTGCELRCFCESGTLDCQNICTPLPLVPPQTLRCQPNYKPGAVNISEDDCCKQWGCVPINKGTPPPTMPAKTLPFLPTIPPEIHFPEDPNEFTNNNDLHHSSVLPTPPKTPPQFPVPGLVASQPLDNSKLTLRSLVSDTPTSIKILFELSPVLVGLRGSVDLRYTDKDDEDIARWYSQIFAPTDEVLTTARLEFRLTGLKPSTVYKLRGKLYLLNLALEPVSDIYTVRTMDEAPVEEKRRMVEAGLRILKVNSSTAQVSWRHFTEEELQYIDGIQVRYRPIEQPIYSMTELLHHWRVSVELTDLRPGTNYEASLVLVAPSKSRVELYDPRTVNFTTPQYYDMYNFNVTVEARRVGSESVEVTWSGVPAPPERYIRVYRAAHSCDGTMAGPGLREHDTFKLADRDQPPVILLEGLRADSKCRVWLELFLTNGKVKISNVLDITTKTENSDNNVDNYVKASSVAGNRSGHTNGDYYSALVVVGVVAALGTLTSLLLLLVVMRRHRPHSVSITTVPSAPRAPSLPPYDNPAYKLELQQETMDL